MPKYTVVMLAPYCTWEDVNAQNKEEAIKQCSTPPEFDGNDICTFIAIPERTALIQIKGKKLN